MKRLLALMIVALSCSTSCMPPCAESACSSAADCQDDMVCYLNEEADVGEREACSGVCAIVHSRGCETGDDCEENQFCSSGRCLSFR